MISRPLLLSASLALSGFASASETVSTLWHQAPDLAGINAVHQDFPDSPNASTYIVNDVSFDANVTVTSVTTYFTNFGNWAGAPPGPAILNIFPADLSDLPMDSDDPAAGTPVTASYSVDGGSVVVTVSDLAIDLPAGDYWVGITPVLSFSQFGQEFTFPAQSPRGFESAARNPGAALLGTSDWVEGGPGAILDWDAAITIEGTTASALFVDLGNGLAGVDGIPLLEGTGQFSLGESSCLELSGAIPSTQAFLVVGASTLNAPLKGGVLVPAIDLLLDTLSTTVEGALSLPFALPATGIPVGTDFYFQAWLPDAAGVANFSASNGLQGTVQ